MSTIFCTSATPQGMAGQSHSSGLVAVLRRWWVAYLARRIEQAAIAQLGLMSDRELKDIGLTRSQIGYAVRGEPGEGAFSGYY